MSEPEGRPDESIPAAKQIRQSIFENVQATTIQTGDIHQTIHLPSTDRPTTTRLQDIPYRGSSHFLGRDQALTDLHQALQQNDRVAITAIAGMGGVGKTELAIQYARQRRESYPGGVCWLRARESSLEAQLLQKVELELGLSVPQEWRGKLLSLAEQVQWCWNNWQPDGLVLVVLDDVTSLADCRAVLPTDQRFRVVLTTRQRGLDAGFVELRLDVLAEEDAIALLREVIGVARVEREPSEAAELCAWLGYLPLGLELVGRYLGGDRPLSLREMRERLKAQSIQDGSVERGAQYQMTAQLGVKSAFELTWQTLDAATAEVAMLLSLFAADVIPWVLVEWMTQRVHGEDHSTHDARRGLDNCYLIQPVDIDEGDKSGAYKLHPLIREFLQTKLAEFAASEPLRQAFVDGLIRIAQKMPQTPTIDLIEVFAIIRPHLEEVANGMSDRVSDDDLPWAFVGLARFYEGQGLYALAEPWCRDYLTVMQARLGAEHPDVAAILSNLAGLYESQGRYSEAEPLYLQALDLSKRLLGAEHPDVAAILSNLAGLYKSQGRYSEAEPLYLQALDLSKRLLGAEHPDVAAILSNLAGLYKSQGRYSEAEPLYLQALDLSKRLLGAEHPDVAAILSNLAGLYKSQGRYSEAEPLYVQALEMRKRLLGEEHPAVAAILNNLAGLYESQGRYSEAEPLYVQALEMSKRLLGAEHPDVAISLNNLAHLYYSQGRYSEAEPLYLQALEMSKRLLGAEHPNVASSLNNLGLLYKSQGRYSETEPLYMQALEMSKRLLGAEHPTVATRLNNLAFLYNSQGRYSEAEPLYLQALSICRQKLGDNHPNTRACRQNLEYLHQQMHPDRPSFHQKRRAHPLIQFLRAIIRFLKRLFRL